MNGPNCPWCGLPTDAEFVDIGVGFQQVSGGHCLGEYSKGTPGCGSYEMARHQIDGRLTEVEMVVGWHGPLEDHVAMSPFNPETDEDWS